MNRARHTLVVGPKTKNLRRASSEIEPLYLLLDGLTERLRPGAKREAILCA